MRQLAEGDFARQAQMTAAQLARQAQLAGKNASDGFNRFVEGSDTRREAPLDESKKSFWDDFSNLADERAQQQQKSNSAIGTSAIGMGKKGGAAPKKQADEWDDW